MTIPRKYCPNCKSEITRKKLENRLRDYCSSCDKIFYDNPLPVVSAVVPNKKREILLVLRDRDPYSGQWCLPSGFVELNESPYKPISLNESPSFTGIFNSKNLHCLKSFPFTYTFVFRFSNLNIMN